MAKCIISDLKKKEFKVSNIQFWDGCKLIPLTIEQEQKCLKWISEMLDVGESKIDITDRGKRPYLQFDVQADESEPSEKP